MRQKEWIQHSKQQEPFTVGQMMTLLYDSQLTRSWNGILELKPHSVQDIDWEISAWSHIYTTLIASERYRGKGRDEKYNGVYSHSLRSMQ